MFLLYWKKWTEFLVHIIIYGRENNNYDFLAFRQIHYLIICFSSFILPSTLILCYPYLCDLINLIANIISIVFLLLSLLCGFWIVNMHFFFKLGTIPKMQSLRLKRKSWVIIVFRGSLAFFLRVCVFKRTVMKKSL